MQLLPCDHLEKRPRSQLGGLPQVRPSFPLKLAPSFGNAAGRRSLRRIRRRPRFERSAAFHLYQALRAALERGAAQARNEGRHPHRRRPPEWTSRDLLLDGIRIHRRFDGRRGRRERSPRRRALPPAAPAPAFFLVLPPPPPQGKRRQLYATPQNIPPP